MTSDSDSLGPGKTNGPGPQKQQVWDAQELFSDSLNGSPNSSEQGPTALSNSEGSTEPPCCLPRNINIREGQMVLDFL